MEAARAPLVLLSAARVLRRIQPRRRAVIRRSPLFPETRYAVCSCSNMAQQATARKLATTGASGRQSNLE